MWRGANCQKSTISYEVKFGFVWGHLVSDYLLTFDFLDHLWGSYNPRDKLQDVEKHSSVL